MKYVAIKVSAESACSQVIYLSKPFLPFCLLPQSTSYVSVEILKSLSYSFNFFQTFLISHVWKGKFKPAGFLYFLHFSSPVLHKSGKLLLSDNNFPQHNQACDHVKSSKDIIQSLHPPFYGRWFLILDWYIRAQILISLETNLGTEKGTFSHCWHFAIFDIFDHFRVFRNSHTFLHVNNWHSMHACLSLLLSFPR